MISLKRQRPSLSSNSNDSKQEVDLEQLENCSKKLKSDSLDKSKPSPYEDIPEVPNIKLTVSQMNSDPLALVR